MLSAPNQKSNDIILECGCSISDIPSCPSARIIEILLKRFHKWTNTAHSDNEQQSDSTNAFHSNESEIIQSLHSVFEKYDYSVTKLMDDLHHLKYEHNIDRDDALFDSAYEFFKESMTESGCDIENCPFFEIHHRDRGAADNEQKGDTTNDLLVDTLSLIHYYLLHSYETQRFSNEERQMIMEMAGATSWSVVNSAIRGDSMIEHDDEKRESVDLAVMTMITEMLTKKRQTARGRSRFRDNEDEEKSDNTATVDFAAMSQVVGVEEAVLQKSLGVYKKDRQLLIGDLIDVVYGEDNEKMSIWNSFDMDAETKRKVLRQALHGHFHCFQLNVSNLAKICLRIIARKRLEISVDLQRMTHFMTANGIDGRMFDKGDPEHYQNNGTFSKRFKAVPGCKVQHVRQLYTAVRKWKYVEWKKVTVESKESEIEDDDPVEKQTKSDQPDVYTIGKRFNFWQRRNDDYVQAKFKDLKEETLQSPLLSVHFQGIKGWNALMNAVEAMIRTKAALKITSNGYVHISFPFPFPSFTVPQPCTHARNF